MEPVTHLLTGACLARTGFHRRVAYATAAMAVAAEFPDIDTVWRLRGPVSGFEHHRGITHTFLGVPFEAGLLLLAVFAWDAARNRRRSAGDGGNRPLPGPVPRRWGALYGLLVLAMLSHLLLDYTNNYGLRPFFPFNDRWYAGSIVFIFDPLIFAILLAGLLPPAMFRLVGREVGADKGSVPGSGWARAALAGVCLLWGVRTYEHGRALDLAERTTLRAPANGSVTDDPLPEPDIGSRSADAGDLPVSPGQARPLLQPLRASASPDPLSIFRWYTAVDFGPVYQVGLVDSRVGTSVPGRLLIKPEPTPSLDAAERSRLGRIYLDWSSMPFINVDRGEAQVPGAQTILFEDPRFMGEIPVLDRKGPPPLSGEVVLRPDGTVLAEGMDGQYGR